MIQRVCSNPECNAVYAVEDDKADDLMGCCNFECWEKVFCKGPPPVLFPNIELDYDTAQVGR